MATQKEREDDDLSFNSSSDDESRRDDETIVSTSDSDTAVMRSMIYNDRFRMEFGDETQQSESDNSEDEFDNLPKRSKTEERRVSRVTSRESQFEFYSEKNDAILYEPGKTKFLNIGKPVEILVEQIAVNPPPRELLEVWIINALLDEPWFPSRVTKLHIGKWTSCVKEDGGKKLRRIIKTLVQNKPKMSNVRSIEIGSPNVRASDLYLCDISKIFELDSLARLKVRGNNGLTISSPRVCNLHSFVVEGTGCLSKSFLQGFAECQWPNLISLELWLGSNEEGYGYGWSCDDLSQIFKNLPHLQNLALRNSNETNEIVESLITKPDLISQLAILDLSYGTLDDNGANLLSEGMPNFSSLTELVLNHHFVSNDILKHLFRENLFIIETLAETTYWGSNGENKPRFV